MRPLRIGVVGLGVISRYYLTAIEGMSSVRLASVCDLDEARLARYRGNVACYPDHRAMFAGTALDAVVVTVPNDAHFAVCEDALSAGIAVCVEKPLATTVAQGAALAQLAAERNRTLFTAFHRRYNENVLALAGRVRGERIESVTVRYLERIEEHVGADRWYLDPERCGGGCVADNGPNAIDLARLLVGPLDLRHVDIRRDDTGVDRQAVLDLRSDRTAVRIVLDWSYPGEAKDIEVRLADGRVLGCDMLAGHPGFKASLWHEYTALLADFAHSVSTREDRSADGLAALSTVDAAYRLERGMVARSG